MIDCMLIGHYKGTANFIILLIKLFRFFGLHKLLKILPINSKLYVLYKYFQYSWIKYKGKIYSASEIFEMVYDKGNSGNGSGKSNSKNIFSLTIAYLGTFLKKKGLTFDYLNSFDDRKDILIKRLCQNEIRAIAILTTFYIFSDPVMKIIKFIRMYNKTVKIIVGGPYILNEKQSLSNSDFMKLLKKINADFYIVDSQGEDALAKVLYALKNDSPVHNIYNLIYKNGNKYHLNPERPEYNKLDDNIVDWEFFSDKLGDMVLLRTSISCPFSCAYCGFPKLGGKYYAANPETIIKELNAIQNIKNVKRILFIDDTFNVPLVKYKNILRAMVRNRYTFNWSAFIRAESLDKEAVELMKESGCKSVLIGFESAHQKILDNMNKKTTVEDYRRALDLLNEYGIISLASFIVGFPGETPETFRDTVGFIEKYKPTYYQLHVWSGIRSAPIYEQSEKYNIKGDRIFWSHNTMNSRIASELIEQAYLAINNSIAIPALDFDLSELDNRGYSPAQIRTFLKTFNNAVKMRLQNKMEFDIINKLRS
ncbi:MAG: radical SAM protein [Spirochaetales bacterium]|nr:radical SAM protein [Spirochaetales bacterium]